MELTSDNIVQEQLHAAAIDDILKKERNEICKRSGKRRVLRNNEHNRIEHDFYLANIQEKTGKLAENPMKEENISRELRSLEQKKMIDLKMRQHVRETSEELRQIEAKLRAAYVQKEIVGQIAEKNYLKMQDKIATREADEMLAQATNDYKQLLLKQAEDDAMKKYQYKQELEDQMILHSKNNQHQYEEFLREKKTIDSIIQRIHDEDRIEMEKKMIQMSKTRKEIEAFKTFQEMWKQKERVALEEETKRIAEFLKEKEIQQKQSQEDKLKQAAEKEAIRNNLATQLYAEQVKRKEREEIIQELLVEEVREREEEKLKEKIEKAIQLRINSQNMMAAQLEEKKERLKREELEEAQYRQQLINNMLEDEKLEQLSAEKRRRKIMEYRRSVEETIQARRIKRTEELRHLLYMQEQDKLQVQTRKKIIEEERLKLLKQHAQNLIGYLPSGILREEDLPHLGTEVVKQYKRN